MFKIDVNEYYVCMLFDHFRYYTNGISKDLCIPGDLVLIFANSKMYPIKYKTGKSRLLEVMYA